MNTVALSAIQAWRTIDGYYVPTSLDFLCPNCEKLSNHIYIRHSGMTFGNNHGVWSIEVRCTRCQDLHLLWMIGLRNNSQAVKAIYLHPPAKAVSTRKFDDFENGVVPEKILRVYRDAVRSYDAEIWDGAATLCGKTLEGVIKTKLTTASQEKGKDPKDVKNLAQQLKALNSEIDLSEPFNRLSEAIKDGRNIGAHFDATIETDKKMASALLDLVEHVLEFIFVFEHKANALKERIIALSEKSEPEQADLGENPSDLLPKAEENAGG